MVEKDATNEKGFVWANCNIYDCPLARKVATANYLALDRPDIAYLIELGSPQENLEIEIVDYHDKRQLLAATAVFSIHGKVSNNLLA